MPVEYRRVSTHPTRQIALIFGSFMPVAKNGSFPIGFKSQAECNSNSNHIAAKARQTVTEMSCTNVFL